MRTGPATFDHDLAIQTYPTNFDRDCTCANLSLTEMPRKSPIHDDIVKDLEHCNVLPAHSITMGRQCMYVSLYPTSEISVGLEEILILLPDRSKLANLILATWDFCNHTYMKN